MERVHLPSEDSTTAIGSVAVAVKLSRASTVDDHVGLVYRQDESVYFMHLVGHLDLRRDEYADCCSSYAWVDPLPEVDRRRLRIVQTVCQSVFERNNEGGLPYAFSSPENVFESNTGEFIDAPNNVGLTCASLVLSLFEAAGLPLVEYGTWHPRSEDTRWQMRAMHKMRESWVGEEHIDAADREVGNVRVTPAEVAASATEAPDVTFEQAKILTDKLRRCLLEREG